MKELLEVIAKALADHPDEISISEEDRSDAIVLSLKVVSADMGKVIGKGGKTANAIRRIMNAANTDETKRVLVDIDEK